MHSLNLSILKTITYFDIFLYPLNKEEITFFNDSPVPGKMIEDALNTLVSNGVLWKSGDFYSLRNDKQMIQKRIKGNKLASLHLITAKRVARILYTFPFIKGIAISGSLSKNYADEKSDLDFFIITSANRLWIVRMLYAGLFKIAGVIGKKDWFCLNYFIDEKALEIKEQNVFTAIETATLMPLKGRRIFEDFFQSNNWVKNYHPNFQPVYTCLDDRPSSIIKRFPEWLLRNKAGDFLNNRLHSFFHKRFSRMILENKQSEKGLTIGAYKAGKHACIPLPEYFQPKILNQFKVKLRMVEDLYYHKMSKSIHIVKSA